MIKIILKTFVIFAAVCLVACEDEPTAPYQAPSYIEGPDGGKVEVGSGEEGEVVAVIPVKTNVEWKAEVRYDNEALGVRSGEGEDPNEWITISPNEGKGNAEITVRAKKNREVTVRKATVAILAAKDPTCEKEVVIEQEPGEAFITPALASLDMGKIKVDTAVVVSSNIECNVTVDADNGSGGSWIVLGVTEIGNADDQNVPFEILTQQEDVDREGKIIFTSKTDPQVADTVFVNQKGEMANTVMTVNNTDSLYVSWTSDPSCVKFDVVVEKDGGEALVTIPDIAWAPSMGIDLLTNNDVIGYEGAISVKVVGKTNDPDYVRESDVVETNTVFGDGSGDGSSEASPINISAMRHLTNIKSTDYGKNFKQTGDIDASYWLSKKDYAPIGQLDAPFTGVYDGGGKSITGLTMKNNNGGSGATGVFGVIRGADAEVKNMTIVNGTLTITQTQTKYDGLAGHSLAVGTNIGGKVTNIRVQNPTITVNKGMVNVAAVCGVNIFDGTMDAPTAVPVVSNCLTQGGSITLSGGSTHTANADKTCHGITAVGGVVGVNWPDACLVEHCENNGTAITSDAEGAGSSDIAGTGGVVGLNDALVKYCKNTADILAKGKSSYTGGVVGGVLNISGTDNHALTTDAVDPMVKYPAKINNKDNPHRSFSEIHNSYNTGNITIEAPGTINGAGGVAGACKKEMSECYNTGNLVATGTANPRLGGVGGRVVCDSGMNNCYNSGKVLVTSNIAEIHISGVWAYPIGAVRANYCYNVGEVANQGPGGGKLVTVAIAFANKYGGDVSTCFALEGCAGASGSTNQIGSTVRGWVIGGTDSAAAGKITPSTAEDNAKCFKSADELKTASTWINAGYDQSIWNIVDGAYPTLIKTASAGVQ